MMYSTDVRIMSTVIYSFCDILEKRHKECSVN